ncbi:trace amine-associated receptor 1-like, partial [Kryptolebias marmoratus]|uniref:trace amine-associated receptor 1-like n=1 Tax=Kryptolebias marmoratus TaxID=37003 RepID=UPI0018ACE567
TQNVVYLCSSAFTLVVCGNLLVIISIIYFKHLRTPTNSLILSLAVADLLVGIIVFPFSMAFSLSSCMYHEGLFCKVRGSFDILLSTCSIMHLCCISIDRYYAVCQPLTYKSKISRYVVVIMIAVSWGVSALIGIGVTISGLNNEQCEETCFIDILMANTVGPILSFYLPVVIMLCIYLKIFLVALRQARSIQTRMKCGATVSKMERKATKTLATVLGVFLFCWTPFFLCITFLPFTNNDFCVLGLTVFWCIVKFGSLFKGMCQALDAQTQLLCEHRRILDVTLVNGGLAVDLRICWLNGIDLGEGTDSTQHGRAYWLFGFTTDMYQ